MFLMVGCCSQMLQTTVYVLTFTFIFGDVEKLKVGEPGCHMKGF